MSIVVPILQLSPLTADLLPSVLELDRRCFGKLWSLDGYQRELDSPNSELLVFLKGGEMGRWGGGEMGRWGDGEVEETGDLSPTPPLPYPPTPSPLRPPAPPPPSPTPLLALGCYWAILEEAHITILAVDPHYSRQGLGQSMLVAMLASARQRGLERATLEVRASNQAAIDLYQKFGFREAGRRRRYYEETGEDALILWRGDLQYPQFCQTLQDWQQQVDDRLLASGWQRATGQV